MQEIIDYEKVFSTLIDKTEEYILSNNLHAMILGISGGIDSTVVAAICHEVSKRTGIPLIGRSLPTRFNKEEEINTADLVGKAFCNEYTKVSIKLPLESFNSLLDKAECGMTAVANGNIQARLRMIYLYHLASINKGLVMDTDNLTENNLGYFTIHGDVGDFNPIGCLWKTEVFKLAEWLIEYYQKLSAKNDNYYEVIDSITKDSYYHKLRAIKESLKLKPTAGLGITDSDLDEIGAESYEQVDSILQEILRLREKNANKDTILEFFYDHSGIDYDIVTNIVNRHFNSEFKRKQLPIKITRDEV